MANPRRTLFPASANHHQLPVSTTAAAAGDQSPATLVNSLKSFLKKPHAFPFLLSFFLLLTWVTLRFQRPSSHFPAMGLGSGMGARRHWSSDEDDSANLVRFSASSPLVAKDKRGWLLNPISLALDSRISGLFPPSRLRIKKLRVFFGVRFSVMLLPCAVSLPYYWFSFSWDWEGVVISCFL